MSSPAISLPVPQTAGAAAPSRAGAFKKRLRESPVQVWTVSLIALTGYLFVVHSYKLNIGSVCIVIGLLAVMLKERPILFSAPIKWYAAYLGWSLLLLPLSMDMGVSWQAWVDSLKLMLIMFLALNAIKNEKQHRVFTLAYLAFFAFYPVRGTLFNFLTGQSHFGRYAWNFTFSNFNDLAALTLIPLAFSIDRLRSAEKKWIKLCAAAGLLVLPFIILITESRGGMLGAAVFLLYLLARSRHRIRLGIALTVVGIGAAAFAPQSVWDRILGMQHLTSVETLGEADSSAEQRYLIWQVAGAVIKDNPLGVGIGAYPLAHQRYARYKREWAFARGARDSHNAYLRIFAEGGIIALGLFMMIFVTSFRELMKTKRRLKNSALPEDKIVADRCLFYQAAFLGLAVCAVFGSLETVVFPFLLVSMSTTIGLIWGGGAMAQQAAKPARAHRGTLVQTRAIAR